MRRRSVMYAILIVVAIVFGVLAAGLPSHRSDPTLRVSARVPTTTTSLARAISTTTTSTTVPPAHAPGSVTVLVGNASGVAGAGAKRSDAIGAAGYHMLNPVDADTSKVTVVFYARGYERDATAVAKVISAPFGAVQAMPASPPVSDLRSASVLVVVGSDLASP